MDFYKKKNGIIKMSQIVVAKTLSVPKIKSSYYCINEKNMDKSMEQISSTIDTFCNKDNGILISYDYDFCYRAMRQAENLAKLMNSHLFFIMQINKFEIARVNELPVDVVSIIRGYLDPQKILNCCIHRVMNILRDYWDKIMIIYFIMNYSLIPCCETKLSKKTIPELLSIVKKWFYSNVPSSKKLYIIKTIIYLFNNKEFCVSRGKVHRKNRKPKFVMRQLVIAKEY